MNKDSSNNVIIEAPAEPDLGPHQTKYMKYKYSNRLHYWRQKQELLHNHIARLKKAMEKMKTKYENYRLRLWEYEGYVINHIVEPPPTLLEATAMRLGERLETLEENERSDEEGELEDMDDVQSVSTCDTELGEMRDALRKRR